MARVFDIIEYMDEGQDEIAHRFPERGSGDFRIGSQLIWTPHAHHGEYPPRDRSDRQGLLGADPLQG
jgi:hypothetical protein